MRDRVAAYAGVSGRTLDKIKAVVDAATAEPAKYGGLVAEMDRTGKVDGAYKKLVVRRKAEAIEAEPPPLPTGPFRVVVADPPWRHEGSEGGKGSPPYPQMEVEEIAAMPVGDIVHRDAVLWLWTTNAHMPRAFEVVDAWGFEHRTILTWVKGGISVGNWLRQQTEHCVLSRRGKPTVRAGTRG